MSPSVQGKASASPAPLLRSCRLADDRKVLTAPTDHNLAFLLVNFEIHAKRFRRIAFDSDAEMPDHRHLTTSIGECSGIDETLAPLKLVRFPRLIRVVREDASSNGIAGFQELRQP